MVLCEGRLRQTVPLPHSASCGDNLRLQVCELFRGMESSASQTSHRVYDYVQSSTLPLQGACRPGNGLAFASIQERLQPIVLDLPHEAGARLVIVFLLLPSSWSRWPPSYWEAEM